MTGRTLRDEMMIGDVGGLRTLFVVPIIPDDAPDHIREGIARRRLVTLTGICPCGARRPKLSRQQRRAIERGRFHGSLNFVHENDCSASDETLIPALRAWVGGQP